MTIGFEEIQRLKREKIEPTCDHCRTVRTTQDGYGGVEHACLCGLRSRNYKPLVTNETLLARRRAHYWFDKIWKKSPDGIGAMKRTAAYRWLRGKLGLPPDLCHMSVMDEAQANHTADLAREYVQSWESRHG